MGSNFVKPAALLFTEQELGGPVYEQETINVVGGTAAQVIQGNGERVGLLMINLTANDIYISLNGGVTAFNGIYLPPLGGLFACNVRDDFTLCTRAWFAVGSVGGLNLFTLEIIRYRDQPGGGY